MPNKNAIGYRPTWAEVNLDHLEHNFKEVKSLLRPQTEVLVTVKADAYGHGLVAVAKRLVACGVDYLGVASIDEGIELRKAGIETPILPIPVSTLICTGILCFNTAARVLIATAIFLSQTVGVSW